MCNQPLNQIFFSNIHYILHIFMPIIIRNLLKYIFWNSRFFLLYRFKSCMKSINYFLNKFRLYLRTLLNDGKRLKLERKREREKKRVWKKKKGTWKTILHSGDTYLLFQPFEQLARLSGMWPLPEGRRTRAVSCYTKIRWT